MNEKSQELLTELRDAMEKMPNDPEGLAGWLLSNYRLQKIGDAQPVNFYGRSPAQQQHHPQQGGPMPNVKVNNNNIVQQMLARTGVAKSLANRPNPRDIVNQIHSQIEAEEDLLAGDDFDMYDGEGDFSVYEEDYQPAAPMARQALANNSLIMGDGNSEPMTPEEARAMIAALGGQAQAPGENLHPVLQADRMKRLAAQQDVASGLGAGKIRRSG